MPGWSPASAASGNRGARRDLHGLAGASTPAYFTVWNPRWSDYIFFLVYSLIGLEIGLRLFGARPASGFRQFLENVSVPLLGPFRGLMPDPALGPVQLMLSYIVALLVYVLLHTALKKPRLLAHREARI